MVDKLGRIVRDLGPMLINKQTDKTPLIFSKYCEPFKEPTVDDCVRHAEYHRAQWDARIAQLKGLKEKQDRVDGNLADALKQIGVQIKFLERQARELAKQELNGFQGKRAQEITELRKKIERLVTSTDKTKQEIDAEAVQMLKDAGVTIPNFLDLYSGLENFRIDNKELIKTRKWDP